MKLSEVIKLNEAHAAEQTDTFTLADMHAQMMQRLDDMSAETRAQLRTLPERIRTYNPLRVSARQMAFELSESLRS
jgi:hypothetical protein